MEKLKDLIITYDDFPKEGIAFKELIAILQEPGIFKEVVLKMSSSNIIKNAEAIISVDARGFIFGSAISLQSLKPMIVARKPGKLPGELLKKSYKLEYGYNSLSIQKESLRKYQSYAIVDDLLATGGTVNCVSSLIEEAGKKNFGLVVVAELKKLDARSKLKFPIDSLIKF